MSWYVLVDSDVVLVAADEATARQRAEQIAVNGGTAVVAQEAGTCRPAPAAPSWD